MTIAVHPAEPTPALAETLALAGVTHQLMDDHELEKLEALDAIAALVVELGDEPLRRLRVGRRVAEDSGMPVFLVVDVEQLALIGDETFYTDLIVAPIRALELRLRLLRLTADSGSDEDLIEFEDLTINSATYQVTIADRPIDMTFMEYQLLTFFVENRGRVWSREQLLSKVWGYDYYGGARTVDVHVRRLRSKVGEERAHWITTVRSVGYRFG